MLIKIFQSNLTLEHSQIQIRSDRRAMTDKRAEIAPRATNKNTTELIRDDLRRTSRIRESNNTVDAATFAGVYVADISERKNPFKRAYV